MKHTLPVFGLKDLTSSGFACVFPVRGISMSVIFLVLITSFAFSQDGEDSDANPLRIEEAAWKTPDQYEYTHLFLFEATGDFVPKSPKEFSEKFRAITKKAEGGNVVAGSFKAGKGKEGQIIGRVCTNTPENLKETIALSPDVKLTRIIALTPEVFEKHTGVPTKKTSRKKDLPPRVVREGTLSAQEKLDSYKAEGFAHLLFFEPDGKFRPETEGELLARFTEVFRGQIGVMTGCFNCDGKGKKPLGWVYVNGVPVAVRLLETSPDLKPLKVYRLTPEIVKRYPCKRDTEVTTEVVWKTPDTDGFTHLIYFEPKGGFQPKTEQEFIEKCEEVFPGNVPYGYLRAEKEGNSKFVGRVCTSDLEEMKAAFETTSDLKMVKAAKLTETLFYQHTHIPTVAKTIPENGEAYLDPKKFKQLSITFDRDMDTSSADWGEGGEFAPETTGEIKWTSKRNCLLPVKLEPGKTYLIEINSSEGSGFCSEEGLQLPPMDFVFETVPETKPAEKK